MNVIVDRPSFSVCAECGQIAEEAVVRLGTLMENRDYEWSAEPFCLPCLKRAVAEAEAAVRDAEWERRAGDEP